MQKECVTEIELRSSITEFEGRLAQVDQLQSQIEDEVEQSKIEEIVEEAFCYSEKQKEVKVRAQICLQKLSEIQESHTSDLNTSQTSTSSHVGKARLPKLELPKFSGNYLEFTSFFDKFLAVVDKGELPAVTKFTYLQSLLTGEALASINGLTVTNDSYPMAKDILTKRYGWKERIHVIFFSHTNSPFAAG
ncbi:Pao retrotransposon peptidase family protein [Elysia marginata]|uniref:Pao retrotransposon peptidase family protein n=1 Tax=Elysia marginata TaxID=1093978 RepID=A0AAV4FT66_9GAST|nr:Pao retrotransposon peptidase family protein [Elysia marginata]